jgi:hypothetical protein
MPLSRLMVVVKREVAQVAAASGIIQPHLPPA